MTDVARLMVNGAADIAALEDDSSFIDEENPFPIGDPLTNGNGAASVATLVDVMKEARLAIHGDAKPPDVDTPERGSFEERFRSRRVDLFDRLDHGITPLDFLPASERMLVRGKRHHKPAPKKTGKSLSTLRHGVDMVLAGARVVILDRENGADLYATRLGQIMASMGINDEQRAKVRAGLTYYEFPRLRDSDRDELLTDLAGADLVIFDGQRRFLSDLGLDEDKSGDYAKFMGALVDPLFDAGIATLILDNTGHGDQTRGRGSSAKADLNEISFILETVEPYSTSRVGKIRLRLEPGSSRFGNEGTWEMTIGAGVYGPWELVSAEDVAAAKRHTHKTAKLEKQQAIRAVGITIVEHDHVYHLADTDYRGMSKTAFVEAFMAAQHGSRALARATFDALVHEAENAESRSPNASLSDPSASTELATDFALAVHRGDRTGGTYLKPSIHAGRHPAEPRAATDGSRPASDTSADAVASTPPPYREGGALAADAAGPTNGIDQDELERLTEKHRDLAEAQP